MEKNIIRWGIIGCGDVTEVKSGPAFNMAENSKLVAVMRRNGSMAEDYAKRHGVPKWYNSAEQLIHDPEVDAVYIATPPSSHKEYTLAAAEAKKPVYVEKPMALNYAECQEMIEKCETMQVPLFVAYYRRALPKFLKIREIISSGILGNISSVEISFLKRPSEKDMRREYHWRIDPAVAGGGYFYDLASHQIDILQFFFGEITSAAGYTINKSDLYKAEDVVSAAFKFSNNITGSGTWNFNSWKDEDVTVIIGDRGSITFSIFGNDPMTVETNSGKENILIENPRHIQLPLIQKIVNELLGRDFSPSTGYSGSETNRVMDWIFNSMI